MGTELTPTGFYIPDYEERFDKEKNADWHALNRYLQNISGDGKTFSPETLSGGVVGGASVTSLLGPNLSINQNGELEATDTNTDTDTNTQAVALRKDGEATLSAGKATVDTGVAVDTTSHWDVWPSPPSGVDIAASIENNGSTYIVHLEENTSTVGNPTVGYQLVESNL